MAEPLLSLAGLTLRYATRRGPVTALDDVALAIPRGGAMGLVGESGSGKSSVVLAMLGLLGPGASLAARRMTFDGADLAREAPVLRGRRIGMVFQDPAGALNPALPIGFQVAEPLVQHRGMAQAEAGRRAVQLLEEMQVPRAAAVARSYPHQLSGGMKQRAVIATALACEPELLLLDEPTTALDVTVEAQILDLLAGLRRTRGLSLLLVSHNLGIVERLCDDLTVLYAGRVVERGPTREVLAAPRHPYTRGLMAALPRPGRATLTPIPGGLPDLTKPDAGCNFRPRCPFAVDACAAPQPLLGEGRSVRCHRAAEVSEAPWPQAPSLPRPVVAQAAPLLEAEALTRRFSLGGGWFRAKAQVTAVDGVTLHLRRGEVLGLVGESGCGKSTLGRLALRLLEADGGSLRFDGAAVAAEPPLDFRRRAQIVFQNPDSSLNPRQTIRQALRRPLEHFGLAQGTTAEREVDRLLELVRLPASYGARYPHQLSGGEKQRIGIARALASKPELLVCDEAVSALDVSVQAAVLNLLAELRASLGLAMLFISHDIGVIAHVADRIAVMYRGAIVEEGPAEAVLSPPWHPYTEALLSAVPVVGEERQRIRLAGDVGAAPAGRGCRFAARCPRKLGALCDEAPPPLRTLGAGHVVTCHIAPPPTTALVVARAAGV